MKTFYYYSFKAILCASLFFLSTNSQSQIGIKNCSNGFHHNLFVTSADSLWVFGENADGQLGDGTTLNSLIPENMNVKVTGMGTGYNYSFYIDSSGTLMATGANKNGELGIGSTTSKKSWTPVNSTKRFKYITGAADHSLAIANNDDVYAWGANDHGEVGDSTRTQRTSPIKVKKMYSSGNFKAKKVACGSPDDDLGTGGHSVALLLDGTVWTWGLNSSGQLGDGTNTDRWLAVQVKGIGGTGFLTNVIDIAASGSSAYALLSDSTVVAWGGNVNGQLGDGTTNSRNYPARIKTDSVRNFTRGVQISASGAGLSDDFLAILRSDGKIWNVGANNRGQLGIGSVINQSFAVQNNPTNNRIFKQVVATGHYQIQLSSDTLGNYCESGHQTNGSFGNGSSANFLITGASCVSQAFVALPVSLSSFSAKRADEKTSVIRWTTVSETNNDHFDLEYSADGKEFDVIATIKGGGNSLNEISYQFIHKNSNKTKTVYYRLKQVDYNGDFEYHKTIVITPGKADANVYSSPNPTTGDFSVTLSEETNTPYFITVMDQSGRIIMQKEGNIYNTPVSEKFELKSMDMGLYFVTIKTNFSSTTEKIIKR